MSSAFETHGAFSWTELLTTDVAAARGFYGPLLGWKFRDMDSSAPMHYTVVSSGDKDIGGIMAVPPEAKGMPPTWGTYVTVQDVDAAAAKVAGLGGKVLMPARDIPGVGRFAVIEDPQGARISLITYTMRT